MPAKANRYELLLLLWAAILFMLGIIFGIMAFSGIAIAISVFTQILFLLSLICFLAAFILIVIEKKMVKIEQEELIEEAKEEAKEEIKDEVS